MNLGGIGDILLSTPALRALRKVYSDAEINLLVSPRVFPIGERMSYIDNVYPFEIQYGGSMPFRKAFHNFLILMKLRTMKFDLAINMRTLGSEKSAKKVKWILALINPGKTVGRDTEGRGYFYDVKIPETDEGTKYEMKYDIETVQALGAHVFDRNIEIEIEEKSKKNISTTLQSQGISRDDIIIGLHPGGMPSRRWPLEQFSEVAKKITEEIDCQFIITGGKDEVKLGKRLSEMSHGQIVDMSGRVNLDELCALINRCDLYISNDTGPMHIAAILRTPLVAIFGPGDVTRFDPRNISDTAIVMHECVDCAPCNRIECDTLICLKVITPKEVTRAALQLLKGKKKVA
jgi:lipopolysaccharide heptosyltransferase II